MKTSTIVSALVVTTCVSAFVTIPDTLPDGVYEVEKQASPEHHPIIKRMDIDPAAADAATTTKRGLCSGRSCSDLVLLPRDGTYPNHTFLTEKVPFRRVRPFCRSEHHTLSLENLHGAVNRLFYTPLFWIPRNTVRFALYNKTVAYICNLGDWGSGSLVEFMEAMRILDERCPAADKWKAKGEGVLAAKLSVYHWTKFYGREIAGVPICQWETEKGGLGNELLDKENKRCFSYVSGLRRLLGGGGETKCNDDATGPLLWQKLRVMFPWYNSTEAATST